MGRQLVRRAAAVHLHRSGLLVLRRGKRKEAQSAVANKCWIPSVEPSPPCPPSIVAWPDTVSRLPRRRQLGPHPEGPECGSGGRTLRARNGEQPCSNSE
mmetsp:Transcript_13765/g.44055  ORF Transcript_13765/g.44055 Transcript_13765/m.44055 type:complete len:99 (+) Transcript_13765:465-761(+)